MNLKFDDLANGAVEEKINSEIQKVFENIKDPNTSNIAKRKLTVSLVFSPDKADKDFVSVDIDVKTTLAPTLGVATRFIIDTDNEGNIVANEWGKEMKGQVSLEAAEEEQPEKNSTSNVIDYQTKAN